MGDFDFVKVVLDRIGDMRWMQVAIKPAKPFAFGDRARRTAHVPVFGLPGNPVSSLVSFELFARPGAAPMMGTRRRRPRPPRVSAPSPTSRLPPPARRQAALRPGRVPHRRATVASTSRSAGGQGSHQLARAWPAPTRLAVLPDGDGVDAGDELDVLLTDLGA